MGKKELKPLASPAHVGRSKLFRSEFRWYLVDKGIKGRDPTVALIPTIIIRQSNRKTLKYNSYLKNLKNNNPSSTSRRVSMWTNKMSRRKSTQGGWAQQTCLFICSIASRSNWKRSIDFSLFRHSKKVKAKKSSSSWGRISCHTYINIDRDLNR